MIQANVHEAKTQLSKLIQRAEAGEEVVIARNGRPAVRLTPVEPRRSPRRLGMFAHKGLDVPNWEQWLDADREIAVQFEAALDAPEPAPRPRELRPEELERLDKLSTEDFISELVMRR